MPRTRHDAEHSPDTNLSFQEGDADLWRGPGLSLNEVSSFGGDLGLTVTSPARYAAFDCEIVKVVGTVDDREDAYLVDVHWPSIMLGDMMVCRAGVTVCAGSRVMNPAVAPFSTLYWAYRRRNRPHRDLSHGWGQNSQWRTSFRRDYRIGAQICYNVDGRNDLAAADLVIDEAFPLSREERMELLIHRCFIVTAKPSDDLWPYDDRLTMSDGA